MQISAKLTHFWVLINVFPAIVNATKFQEPQKSFVTCFCCCRHSTHWRSTRARRGAPVGIRDVRVCQPEACLQVVGHTERGVHGQGRGPRSTKHSPAAELRVGWGGVRPSGEGRQELWQRHLYGMLIYACAFLAVSSPQAWWSTKGCTWACLPF